MKHKHQDTRRGEFLKISCKWCLSTIFNYPVFLEPSLQGDRPTPYKRNTKEVIVFKAFPSPFDVVTPETSELFLSHLRGLSEPASFEIIGASSGITTQMVLQKRDTGILENAFSSSFTYSYLDESKDQLMSHYVSLIERGDGSEKKFEFQFNDYYLPAPFYFPINSHSKQFAGDALDSIFSIFSSLESGELGFYQALFIPARQNWAKIARNLFGYRVQDKERVVSMLRPDGYPLVFVDKPSGKPYHPHLSEAELKFHTIKALEKVAEGKPFFAVNVRVGLFAREGKSAGIFKTIGNALNTLTPGDRKFRVLTREDYYKAGVPKLLHYHMFFNRVSLRPGMLLTSRELSGLIHLPTEDTISKEYPIDTAKGRRPPPDFVTSQKDGGVVIGESLFKGDNQDIILSHKERKEHTHIIGTTGKGKTTLIAQSVLQDIRNNTGVCVIDPHGDLIDSLILPKIPRGYADRVVYFDPMRNPVGINILEVRGKKEKDVLVDDVVSIFKQHSESWGIQIEEILSFGVLTVLSSTEGGHLNTLHKLLSDKTFRDEYLKTVDDDFIVQFWKKQFLSLQKGAVAPVLRRLNTFLRNQVLRKIVSQKKSGIDFRKIMDEGKILLVKLPLGEIGEGNAYLLGSLIVSGLQAAAFSRVDISEEERKPFYLYIDEFQNFITKSIQDCLAGTRKFALGLVLVHHTIGQMLVKDREVADAVLALPRIRICFHVGDEDAGPLAKGFTHYTAEDLTNLDVGEAIVRVGGPSNDFEMRTYLELPILEKWPDYTGDLPPEPEDMGKVIPLKYAWEIEGEAIATETEEEVEHTHEEPEITEPEITETAIIETEITEKEIKVESPEIELPEEKEIEEDKKVILKPDDERFLEFLTKTDTTPLPVRRIYQELGLSANKGNRLKNCLLDQELITETETSLGKAKRKSKVLIPTKKRLPLARPPRPFRERG